MKKVFRIYRGESAPPVYKANITDVRQWVNRNPGEAQSWEEVDPMEELNALSDALWIATNEGK